MSTSTATAALTTALKGFCMGAADIVPGVSGGTIALVFGIYDRLLNNVRLGAKALGSLVKADIGGFRSRLGEVEWSFLLPLAVGLLAAIAALSGLIEGLLHDHPESMAGLFFGLVAGSIVVAWQLLHRRDNAKLAMMLVVGVATFALLGFQSAPSASPPLWAFFGAGSIAICAMILPGISGSFILLMMGMYAAVLGSVHDRAFTNLIVFGLGAIVGLAVFSTALGWLLDNYRDELLAVLIGLMIGSFRVLWPWPHGVGIISEEANESIKGTSLGLPEDGQLLIPLALAIVAFVVVVAVSRLAPSEHPEPATQAAKH